MVLFLGTEIPSKEFLLCVRPGESLGLEEKVQGVKTELLSSSQGQNAVFLTDGTYLECMI